MGDITPTAVETWTQTPNGPVRVHGYGTMLVKAKREGQEVYLLFQNTQYAPDFQTNPIKPASFTRVHVVPLFPSMPFQTDQDSICRLSECSFDEEMRNAIMAAVMMPIAHPTKRPTKGCRCNLDCTVTWIR